MPTIKDLASQFSQAFVGAERTNGDKFRKLRDGSPQWMRDVCLAAHGDMMPDDWRYEFIEAAADAIAECESDDPSEAIDTIEVDIYTSDLTRWLASRTDRYGYCDEFMEEFGGDFKDTVSLIAGGQEWERREVFNLVLDALRDLASDDDESEEPDDEPNPSDVAILGDDQSL